MTKASVPCQLLWCGHWFRQIVTKCLVNVDVRAGSPAPLQVNWQVATACHSRTLRLRVEGISRQLVNERFSIWLTRVVVGFFRTCVPRARRRTSALRCFPFCPTRRAPVGSLHTCHAAVLFQVPEPSRLRQSRQIRLGNCCSESTSKGVLPSARAWYLQKIQHNVSSSSWMR